MINNCIEIGEPMATQERCATTDLLKDQCHHCQGPEDRGSLDFEEWLHQIQRDEPRQVDPDRIRRIDYPSRLWSLDFDDTGRCPCEGRGENRFICNDCLAAVMDALNDTPGLLADLELARTKQVRFNAGRSRPSNTEESPLPWDQSASFAANRLTAAVIAAATMVFRRVTGQTPQLLVDEAVAWLLANPEHLAQDPNAQEIVGRITGGVHRGVRVIERPDDVRSIGPCPNCDADLTVKCEPAPPSARDDGSELYPTKLPPSTECGECETVVYVPTQLTRCVELADKMLLPINELVGAISLSGEVVQRHQIEAWMRGGRLTVHRSRQVDWVTATDNRGRPIHEADGRPKKELRTTEVIRLQVGEVRKIAQQVARRRQQKSDQGVTTAEAAALVSVAEVTIRLWVKRRKLAPIERGVRPLRFWPEDVRKAARRRRPK